MRPTRLAKPRQPDPTGVHSEAALNANLCDAALARERERCAGCVLAMAVRAVRCAVQCVVWRPHKPHGRAGAAPPATSGGPARRQSNPKIN